MQRESQLQGKILRYLESLPHCYAFKVISANRKGVPDIICSYNGYFLAIEVKAPGRLAGVTPLQKLNGDKIMASNGFYLLTDDFETVEAFIEGIGDGRI